VAQVTGSKVIRHGDASDSGSSCVQQCAEVEAIEHARMNEHKNRNK